MSITYLPPQSNDLQRDARRYRQLLLALKHAANESKAMEREGTADLVEAFNRLLPDVASALSTEHAFVAFLEGEPSVEEHCLDLLAAYPRTELQHVRLKCTGAFAEVIDSGKPRVIEPLDQRQRSIIPGLEMFGATHGVLVRVETVGRIYIAGVCNKRDPGDVFLAGDGIALDSIFELMAFGARAGERRLRELESIQQTSAAISAELTLDELLPMIAASAAKVFDVPAASLMLWDDAEENLVIRAAEGLSDAYVRELRIPRERVVAHVAAIGGLYPFVTDDLRQEPFADPEMVIKEDLCSVLTAPLSLAGNLQGVLNIYSKKVFRSFPADEVELAEIFANQAAVAIRNVRLYEKTLRQSEHRRALYEAAKAITAGFAAERAERTEVLDRIAEQAVTRLVGHGNADTVWGAIMLYDRQSHEIQFESVYPPEILPDLEAGPGKRWPLDRAKAPEGRIGITGRAVLERRPQRVKDARDDPDCLPLNPSSVSQVAVPLFDGGEIVGVLSVESDQTGGFDEEDEQTLQGLAEMAVVAIKSAEQTAKLRRAHAMALLGAWGAEIAHDVYREVGIIRLAVSSLQGLSDLPGEAIHLLEEIDRAAAQLDIPMMPGHVQVTHGRLERVEVLVDAVLQGIVEELGPDLAGEKPAIDLKSNLQCEGARLQMTPYWLSRLVHHLVQNARRSIRATGKAGRITLESRLHDSTAEIAVRDTGGGVPPEVVPLLFTQPIQRENGRSGLGLLLVHYIVEAYGGAVRLAWNERGKGACFAFRIPLVMPVDLAPPSE
jgi:GAF domain-containing protein